MTNEQLLKKMSQDTEMRNFSPYTYDFYLRKTKEMIKYFDKPMEEVTKDKLINKKQSSMYRKRRKMKMC